MRAYQEQPITLSWSQDGWSRPYTPDVVVQFDDGRVIVVEVKPWHWLGFWDHWMRWLTACQWCHARGIGFMVGQPGGTVVDLLHTRCDEPLRVDLLHALDDGPLDGAGYETLMLAHGVSMTQVAAVVAAERLDWRFVADRPHPFSIRRPSPVQQASIDAWWRLVASCPPGPRGVRPTD